MGDEQASLLRAMMHIGGRNAGMGGPGAPKPIQRPRTAATTTVYDESRIKNEDKIAKKLDILERAEASLNDQIEKYYDGTDEFSVIKNKGETYGKGIRLTRSLILETSMCEDIEDVKIVLLRDKQIEIFDNNKDKKDGF